MSIKLSLSVKRNFFQKKLKAFSLIEVLFSITLLALGLVAVTLIISRSLGYSQNTRDAIIAVQLAQEGVELVRNVRDNDLAQNESNSGFQEFSNSKHCRANYNDNPGNEVDCQASQGNASRYFLQYSGGFYSHTNTRQRFSRYVYVDVNFGTAVATVVSYVYWDWTGSGMPSYIPSNGGTSNCTLQNKCVYTEAILTHFRP